MYKILRKQEQISKDLSHGCKIILINYEIKYITLLTARSTPLSAAIFLALGEAYTKPPDETGTGTGAAAGAGTGAAGAGAGAAGAGVGGGGDGAAGGAASALGL